MEEIFVTIHGDEWKKSDVIEPIENSRALHWLKEVWTSESESWDHDHCEICGWKLYKCDALEQGVGYRNLENDNWLCIECHDQFINKP